MNRSAKLFAVFIASMLSGASTPKVSAEELPMIKMPEYVISGVEQATSLKGSKIAPELTAHFRIAEEPAPIRPGFRLDLIETPVERPILLDPRGIGYREVEIIAGNLGRAFGRFTAADETQHAGYWVQIIGNRPPLRTALGRKFEGVGEGQLVRWVGREATISPAIRVNETEFQRKAAGGNRRLNRLNVAIDAGSTPVRFFSGRLAGNFAYDWTLLDSDRDLAASHDQLKLDFARPLGNDWLESDIDIDAEFVSKDRQGHSLISVSSLYHRQSGEKLVFRAGVHFYGGKTKLNGLTATDAGESRAGAGVLAGVSWQPPFGGELAIDFTPTPQFISFDKVFRDWPALDSTARGTTIERPLNLRGGYRINISDRARVSLAGELTRQRHRAFLTILPDGAWRDELRRCDIAGGEIKLEFDLTQRVSAAFSSAMREATTAGGPGSNAPFASPAEAGEELNVQIDKVMVSQRLKWTKGAPIDFSSDVRSPDYLDLGLSLHWQARRGLIARVGADNLLDRKQWIIPGYDEPPLTVWAGIEWRGDGKLW